MRHCFWKSPVEPQVVQLPRWLESWLAKLSPPLLSWVTLRTLCFRSLIPITWLPGVLTQISVFASSNWALIKKGSKSPFEPASYILMAPCRPITNCGTSTDFPNCSSFLLSCWTRGYAFSCCRSCASTSTDSPVLCFPSWSIHLNRLNIHNWILHAGIPPVVGSCHSWMVYTLLAPSTLWALLFWSTGRQQQPSQSASTTHRMSLPQWPPSPPPNLHDFWPILCYFTFGNNSSAERPIRVQHCASS